MSARGRRGGGVKVSFFAFQDIITCVSGILLVVTLLMTTMITEDSGVTEGGGGPDRAAELRETQQTLEEARSAVAILQAQITALTDPSTVRAQTMDLREKLPIAKAKAEDLERKVAESGLDMATLTARVQQAARELAELERQKKERTPDMEKLARDLRDRETRAANAHNEWRLVPHLPSNSKIPVMVVVSGDELTIEEFNRPSSRQKFDQGPAAGPFARALAGFNPAVHYFVFYIKPSGVPDFTTLKDLARSRGFDIGFDALLENVVLSFSGAPP